MQVAKGKCLQLMMLVAALTTAPLALAQGQEGAGEGQEDDSGLTLSLGLGVGVAPDYFGSEDYKVVGLPFLSASWGPFFIDPLEGMGVRHMTETGTEFSLKVEQDFGRKERDHAVLPGSDRLRGMGDIKSAVMAAVVVKQHLSDWLAVSGDYATRLNRRDESGDQYALGVEVMPFTLLGVKSERSMLTLGLRAHGGDRDFNQTYFGVTQAQSLRSGYRPHEMKSGIYATSFSVGWNYMFDRQWGMHLGAEAMAYSSDARDSSIVQRGTNYIATAALMYTF